MNVEALVSEMRQVADHAPYHLGHDDVSPFRREVEIDGHLVHVLFTRTVVGRRQFYQLSVGNEQGIPAAIPMPVIQRLRKAFVPKGLMIPSMAGNCYQFLEPIND